MSAEDEVLAEVREAAADGRGRIITGNDAMSKLVGVYLHGFVSGVMTVAANMLTSAGICTDHADSEAEAMAEVLMRQIVHDPLAIEEIRQVVTEILLVAGSPADTLPPESGAAK